MGEWGMNLGHTNHQRSTGVIVTKQHNGLVSQKNTRKPNPPPLCPNTGISVLSDKDAKGLITMHTTDFEVLCANISQKHQQLLWECGNRK
jgi:hypothetical protein